MTEATRVLSDRSDLIGPADRQIIKGLQVLFGVFLDLLVGDARLASKVEVIALRGLQKRDDLAQGLHVVRAAQV